jgi:hypothetical protein
MRVLESSYGWNPIETAPLDEDVTLEVTDNGARPTGCLIRADAPRPAGSARAREAARGHAGEMVAVRWGAIEAMAPQLLARVSSVQNCPQSPRKF